MPARADYVVHVEAPDPLENLLTEFLDLVRYKDRDDINTEQLNYMVATAEEQVKNLAATEGYFSPKTTVRVDRAAQPPVVTVRVEPGPRTTVSELSLGINGAVTGKSPVQAEEVRRSWPLTPGEPFRQETWSNAKQEGLRILQRQRYPAARIASSEARIYPERHAADLDITYDSGPLFTLGPLHISGTQRYPQSIIENVNPLEAGEEYSAERLLDLQRQILRTPYFSNAVVDIDKDPANASQAPVNVRVSEFPTQRIRAGAGYATDTGAHVNSRYTHHNVFGRAWIFQGEALVEQRRQYGSLDLAMPPGHKGYVNSAHTSYERTTLEGIDLRSKRAGLRRSRSTDENDVAYTIEYYRDQLRQIDGAALPPDIFVEPGSHQALVAGIARTWRRVDNPEFPRDGYIHSAQAGIALKGLLTDETFFRWYNRLRRFVPVGRRDLVILRGEFGAVISKGGNAAIPASLLFRAGGTESVRGYAYQSIGNVVNGTVYPTRFLAAGSVEYQHWISDQWGGAAFYDIGTATDDWGGKQFFQGIGAGVRWRSPVGRVNVDLAYGLQSHDIRPHLSLGVAF